ncbi:MAG: KamA family protein [Bacteroidales bacterium]|nr:KamA family protein [Bacteroidales bacterium]MCF6341379.1 KamA family protein [Bacteroidales bacterium]
MNTLNRGEKLGLTVKTLRIVDAILTENPEIKDIFDSSETSLEARMKLREWCLRYLNRNPHTMNYYLKKAKGHSALKRISFRDYAAIRLMDYLDNEGRTFRDPNFGNEEIKSSPIKNLWLAMKHGKGSAQEDFFADMLYLFRQLNGKLTRRIPNKLQISQWMSRHPSGLDADVIKMREENKVRIMRKIVEKINNGDMKSRRFCFENGLTENEKYQKVQEWWNNHRFHLSFAIRTPEVLNEMLDYSLREQTLKLLKKAKNKGIPLFINPHYLSLISVDITPGKTGADKTLRDYIFANRELISEFGKIHAWEKEDVVQPGEPNAAGWILPPHYNVYRRYPEVAVFIPDTTGRACGGLCVSCQRMYDFQSGRFNFKLRKLAPELSWPEKMKELLRYWEDDTQLRDILITGGDAFMNSDESLKQILEEVYQMARRKAEANLNRSPGKKYAEIIRVRLGTRLPVYLPQRITPELVEILADFKSKASEIGVRQFVIQTHIESAMEITPEVKQGINQLTSAGWLVTNQLVLTAAASRRGHTAKLRKVLNDIGVIPYYTFTVKGFMENYYQFATNERIVQERVEEKYLGKILEKDSWQINHLADDTKHIAEQLNALRNENNTSFIATDRSVLNLPGVGKSMTYRTIGITDDGRRILEFYHDPTRKHSPIIDQMGSVVIVESKSINNYLKQMEEIGEDISDYKTIWGYSSSETESRSSLYQYPEYNYRLTERLTNFMQEPVAVPAETALLPL